MQKDEIPEVVVGTLALWDFIIRFRFNGVDEIRKLSEAPLDCVPQEDVAGTYLDRVLDEKHRNLENSVS